jgi:hypothetical protein
LADLVGPVGSGDRLRGQFEKAPTFFLFGEFITVASVMDSLWRVFGERSLLGTFPGQGLDLLLGVPKAAVAKTTVFGTVQVPR